MSPRINLIDPEYFAKYGHPWDQYEWLRANDPVFWHEEANGPGFWAITKYEDICMIAQNPEVFSSSETGPLLPDRDPRSFFGKDTMVFAMDGPQHDRYRKLLARGFTPENLTVLRPRLREIAREIMNAVMQKGTGDFVSEIALRLPSGLIAEMMGMPPQDIERLYNLMPSRHTNDDIMAPPESQVAAFAEMLMYAQSIADTKRKSPGDDLATFWVKDEIDEDRLTDEEFKWFFVFLLMEEGARVTMASGLQLLFDHPDQRDKLMSDIDGLLATAVEEMLRFSGPVPCFKRTAMEDITIRGQHIKAGDSVMLFYASANRDEDVFENPNSFDITRHPNPHVTFGGFGPHQCLGEKVARVEIAVMFKELLTLMPNIKSNGEFERAKTNLIAAIHYMPVKYS
jgi:cytochrome P450